MFCVQRGVQQKRQQQRRPKKLTTLLRCSFCSRGVGEARALFHLDNERHNEPKKNNTKKAAAADGRRRQRRTKSVTKRERAQNVIVKTRNDA